MLLSTQAIVLKHVRVGDNGHLLHLYTFANGPMSVMVRGGKRALLRQVLMQPLSLVDVVIQQPVRHAAPIIKEGCASMLLTSIPYDPAKSAIALYMAELLNMVLKAQHADEHLFNFLTDSIGFLDKTPSHYGNFHLVFTIKLSYFLGIYPNLSNFDEGVYFDLQNGYFTPIVPMHTDYLNQADTVSFAQLMRLNYDNMGVFLLNRQQRSPILHAMVQYYQLHVPGFRDLNSLPILEELFD